MLTFFGIIASIVEPYFCLYVGTNLVEMIKTQEQENILTDFCYAVDDGDLALR